MEEIRRIIVEIERLYGWKLFNEYDAVCPIECLPVSTKRILENLANHYISCDGEDE